MNDETGLTDQEIEAVMVSIDSGYYDGSLMEAEQEEA